ncbi:DUF6270 domain-containing protein [Arthrobacter sp. CAN_A1]|uniref:DUF6270 domain-containing protein n=1 Tax=Arthrobacter sp. CAN_A1 TaxID=2787717 RepID=UPI003FA47D59
MPRVLIFGSCVWRDAFKRLDGSFNLVEYVARQSVISSASAPTKLLGTGNLTSAFQIRSVRNDHRSSLFAELSSAAVTTDLLLMDLVDERLGVVNLSDDTWVTYSAELVRSGALDSLPEHPTVLKFGTDRHFFLLGDAPSGG